MLSLYLTKSKIFDHTDAKGVNHHIAVSRAVDGRPAPVPSWVKETTTFQYGVKDGTIRDLTQPTARVRVKKEFVVEPVEEVEVEEVIDDAATEDFQPAQAAKPRGKKAGASIGLKE
jgi:hypothetical protein